MHRRLRLAHAIVIAVSAFAATFVVGCDEDLIDDATFRSWCGDSLCSWTVESGSVKKAPTWHPKDYGVELVDTPTVISTSTSKTAKCIAFTTVADLDPSAQVTIGIDFNRDGTVEIEQPIAATGFHESKTQITAPDFYDGIRFVITKKGVGHAVLAEMRAQSDDSGCTAAPFVLQDQPLGTPCKLGAECTSGICCSDLCSECCTAPPTENGCGDAGACVSRVGLSLRDNLGIAMPNQCDPGRRDKPSGAECVADDDCASGACVGAKVTGGSVDTAPDAGTLAPCVPNVDSDASTGCIVTSVHGGQCR